MPLGPHGRNNSANKTEGKQQNTPHGSLKLCSHCLFSREKKTSSLLPACATPLRAATALLKARIPSATAVSTYNRAQFSETQCTIPVVHKRVPSSWHF